LIPKKSRRELFQQIFALEIFGGGAGRSGLNRYAAIPLFVALSPGHSDITRFRPWSPIVPDRKSFGSRRKIPKFAQTTGTVDVLDPRSGIAGPTYRGTSACPILQE